MVLILLLILIVGGIVFFGARFMRPGFRIGRRHKRHIITRIICGTLGAGIVIAVAIGTYQQAQSHYAVKPGNEPTIAMATLPEAKVEMYKLPADARLVYQFIVADYSSGAPDILHVERLDLSPPDWSAQRVTFEAGGCRFQLALKGLAPWWGYGHRGPTLGENLSYESVWQFGQSTSFSSRDILGLTARDAVRGPANAYPFAFGFRPDMHLRIFTFAQLVSPTDPLRGTPAEQWAAQHVEELDAARAGDSNMVFRHTTATAEMAAHLGLAAMLLGLAAILFAQLFTRRGLALAGMVTVMILYIAVLDRVGLSINTSHMEDANAPVATRVIGLHQSAETFFFAKTANEHISSLAQDASAPNELRDLAKHTMADFEER
jgi:hypothetical protein